MQQLDSKLLDNLILSLDHALWVTKGKVSPMNFVLAVATAAHLLDDKVSEKARAIIGFLVYEQLTTNTTVDRITKALADDSDPPTATDEDITTALVWLAGASVNAEVRCSIISAIALQLVARAKGVSRHEVNTTAMLDKIKHECFTKA